MEKLYLQSVLCESLKEENFILIDLRIEQYTDTEKDYHCAVMGKKNDRCLNLHYVDLDNGLTAMCKVYSLEEVKDICFLNEIFGD